MVYQAKECSLPEVEMKKRERIYTYDTTKPWVLCSRNDRSSYPPPICHERVAYGLWKDSGESGISGSDVDGRLAEDVRGLRYDGLLITLGRGVVVVYQLVHLPAQG